MSSQAGPAEVSRQLSASSQPAGACWGPCRTTIEALLIQSTAIVTAIFIPEITFVWSVMGSTVCMLVAFILPAACYLSLHKWQVLRTRRCFGALALLILGILLSIVCSVQSVMQLF